MKYESNIQHGVKLLILIVLVNSNVFANDVESLPSIYTDPNPSQTLMDQSNNQSIGGRAHHTYFYDAQKGDEFYTPTIAEGNGNLTPFWRFECANDEHDFSLSPLSTFGTRQRKGRCATLDDGLHFIAVPFDFRTNDNSDKGGNGGSEMALRGAFATEGQVEAQVATLNDSGNVQTMGLDISGTTYMRNGDTMVMSYWMKIGSTTKNMLRGFLPPFNNSGAFVSSAFFSQFHTKSDNACYPDREPGNSTPTLATHQDFSMSPSPGLNMKWHSDTDTFGLELRLKQPNHYYYARNLGTPKLCTEIEGNPGVTSCPVELAEYGVGGTDDSIQFDEWFKVTMVIHWGKYRTPDTLPAKCSIPTADYDYASCLPSDGFIKIFINDRAPGEKERERFTQGKRMWNESSQAFVGLTTQLNSCPSYLKQGIYVTSFTDVKGSSVLPNNDPQPEFDADFAQYLALYQAHDPRIVVPAGTFDDETVAARASLAIDVAYAKLAFGDSQIATRSCSPDSISYPELGIVAKSYDPNTGTLTCVIPEPKMGALLTNGCRDGYDKILTNNNAFCARKIMNETAKDADTPMVVYEYLTQKDEKEEETITGTKNISHESTDNGKIADDNMQINSGCRSTASSSILLYMITAFYLITLRKRKHS